MNMKLRNIPFSPPDMSEKEAKMAAGGYFIRVAYHRS